jgi:tRNA(adenine34) deaminase
VSDIAYSDSHWMRLALEQARLAAAEGEVPVGAVVVKNGELIASGRNAPIGRHDPSAHAEIAALRAAALALGNYRLDGCELFVTLEPCAMCSGAILHARLKRLVFGAADARTGAAGSVLNLFENRQLNHQTAVQGGILAAESALELQAFFRPRRVTTDPLREDALRTPDACFEGLPDYPWPAHYLQDAPALAGLRMHYLDVPPQTGVPPSGKTFLCLHGNPTWSYLYRHMIGPLSAAGHRVVAPDLIGFGKSDKPKKEGAHSFAFHRSSLLALVELLDLREVVLVVQDWGGLLGLTLPMEAPARYSGLLVMNTLLACGDLPLSDGFQAWRAWVAANPEFDVGRLLQRGNPQMSTQECAAYNAPFPDRGHRAALRAFPPMVPALSDSPGADVGYRARTFWQQQWSGLSMMAIGMQDPVFHSALMRDLQAQIRGCDTVLELPHAGHFVPEHGAEIAAKAIAFFR